MIVIVFILNTRGWKIIIRTDRFTNNHFHAVRDFHFVTKVWIYLHKTSCIFIVLDQTHLVESFAFLIILGMLCHDGASCGGPRGAAQHLLPPQPHANPGPCFGGAERRRTSPSILKLNKVDRCVTRKPSSRRKDKQTTAMPRTEFLFSWK